MKQKHTFKWKKDKTTITFKNPDITFKKDSNEIRHFYYDVILKCHHVEKHFRVNDFPKVIYLEEAIDYLLNLDKDNEMFLIDNLKADDFERKTYYQQKLLSDGFGIDYFMKFERYDYEVVENEDDKKKTWSKYNLLIGETINQYDDDTSDCFYIKNIEESEMLKLKSIASEFIQFAIKSNLNNEME